MGKENTVRLCWSTDGCNGWIEPSFERTGPSIYSSIVICFSPAPSNAPFRLRSITRLGADEVKSWILAVSPA
jgi:hypothetical protein